MSEYTLHCFAQSGNAYKTALMLELAGADWKPAFVDFFNGQTRGKAFRDLTVMGEAPVLEHRGRTLTQSGVILEYLAETLGRWGPKDADERREIWRWILWDNHKYTSYCATLRFMLAFMNTGETPVTEFFRGRMKTAFGVLEQHLSDKDWIVGERMTIADFSLCGYGFYNDEYGVDWQRDYPAVGRWRSRIASQPGWKHPYVLMPGHPIAPKKDA